MAVHSYCRNKDITDIQFIFYCVKDCLKDKWRRDDVVTYLNEYEPLFTRKQILERIDQDKELFDDTLMRIAHDLQQELITHTVHFKPIRYRPKYDNNSKKTRIIGIQSVKQQIYDYIAVKGAQEVWDAKIGYYQCASLPGKGQVFGKKTIEGWIRKPETRNLARFVVKGDIRKCYPSISRDKVKMHLKRDIKNDTLLYLMFTLIDSFDKGLSIGSYLSQYLCNYYLSYAYNFMENKLRRYYHFKLFYMDDFIMIGDNKDLLVLAMKSFIEFMHEDMELEIKPNWEVYPIDYIDEHGVRRGRPIDMMGYVMYRDHTKIRDCIFLSARRAYIRAENRYIGVKPRKRLPVHFAYRCVSYFGWFKNSNSKRFIRDYNVKVIVSLAKWSVSKFYRDRNQKGHSQEREEE